MRYLIFDSPSFTTNLARCKVALQIAGSHWGYPNNVGTEVYADPITHPEGVKVAIPILEPDDNQATWSVYREVFGVDPILVDALDEDWCPLPDFEVLVQPNTDL